MSAIDRDQLLVLDVGNTNTVLGLYEGDDLVDRWRVATNPRSTTDEIGVLFRSLFAAKGRDPERVEAILCACVVPPMVHGIRRASQRYFGVDAHFVEADSPTGITLDKVLPEEVGADRIVNAVAAHARHPRACIVVDFGTATTFDVVGGDGTYRGGVIAPGIGISLEALTNRASKLPRVEIRRPDKVVGHRTIESMQSGIVYGYVGLVEGIVARVREEMAEADVAVVATGGFASLIATQTPCIDEVEPDLTLEGLRLIHQRMVREAG